MSCFNKIYIEDFVKKPYKATQLNVSKLRYNGAYYRIDKTTKILDVYFFYENLMQRSIAIDSNHFSNNSVKKSIDSILEKFKISDKYINQYFEDGGYEVKNEKITIQSIRYIPQFAWGVVTYKGEIINDTTLIVTEFKFPQRKILKTDSLHYDFIKVEKPDSLRGNRWRDKKWYWQN